MESGYCKLFKQLTDMSRKTGLYIRLDKCKGIVKEKTPKVKKISKQKEITRLKNKLDSLWSLAVRKRDKRCLLCGKTTGLQAHHWIKRKAQGNKTRWAMDNGITLCYYCHMFRAHKGVQIDAEAIKKVALQVIGEKSFNEIMNEPDSIDNFTKEDLEQIKVAFEKYLK